jgi:hypothetical protein
MPDCPPLDNDSYYPRMYVSTDRLLKRRNYFINNKKAKFSDATVDVPSFLFFSAEAFCAFLKKIKSRFGLLRLFFAVDDHKSLTIVFAAANPGKKDNKYYYLENSDFKESDGRAEQWIENYLEILSCLDGTYERDSNSPTDTKSIEYEMDDVVQIGGEITYQKNKGYTITGVRVWFSSYTDKDKDPNYDPNPPKPWEGIIHKRFIVQFVLVYDNDGTDDILYIDTLGDGRMPAPKRFGEFDTGNICPPRCQQ